LALTIDTVWFGAPALPGVQPDEPFFVSLLTKCLKERANSACSIENHRNEPKQTHRACTAAHRWSHRG
jgi:hypothetical protein